MITVASVAGLVAFPGRCLSASKGAALQLARSIAVDYAGKGISQRGLPRLRRDADDPWRLDVPELAGGGRGRIPLGRVAQPDDVADPSRCCLRPAGLHDRPRAVVDGGWTAV